MTDTPSAPWFTCQGCGAKWQYQHTCPPVPAPVVTVAAAVELQIGWWCPGASGEYQFEALDHPCKYPARLPVYVKVSPAPIHGVWVDHGSIKTDGGEG